MNTPPHIPQWQQRVRSVAALYDEARIVARICNKAKKTATEIKANAQVHPRK